MEMQEIGGNGTLECAYSVQLQMITAQRSQIRKASRCGACVQGSLPQGSTILWEEQAQEQVRAGLGAATQLQKTQSCCCCSVARLFVGCYV